MNNLRNFHFNTLQEIDNLAEGNYFNATALAKKAGKNIQHYLVSDEFQNYAKHLAVSLDLEAEEIMKYKDNYVLLHTSLMIPLGRWIDPFFAIECDKIVQKHI